MNYLDFANKAFPIMQAFKSPETKITDYELSEKTIDFTLWFNPIIDKYNAGVEAIKNKHDKCVIDENSGRFISGDIEDFKALNQDIHEYQKKEIPECPVKFTRAEFKGSLINQSTKIAIAELGLFK